MPLIRRVSWSSSAIFVAMLLGSSNARAESSCEGRPPVQVQVEAASRPALARRTLDLLTAELTARRAPCEGSAGGLEHAQIIVRWLDASRVRIEVELRVSDRAQRAERDVDHGRIPMDGIPSALAIAADELLRAVYEQTNPPSIEVATSSESSPRKRAAPKPPPPITESSPHLLGFALAAEIFPGERAFLGPDARLGFALSSRLSIEAHAGLRALAPAFAESQRARLSRLWLLGVDARLQLAQPLPAMRLAGIAGADAILALHVTPALVRPALRAGLRASWDPGARLRLDAGLDALWLPASLRFDSAAKPIASSLGIAPSLGLLILF